MKCPQILREKTLSQKFAVIALRIQWKLFTEGNAFKKCQQIILPILHLLFAGIACKIYFLMPSNFDEKMPLDYD